MRVCILSRNYPPEHTWGGDGVLYGRQASALVRAGASVTVICQGAPGFSSGTFEGVDCVRVRSDPMRHSVRARMQYTLGAWRAFGKITSRGRIDVVEAPYWSAEALWPALRAVAPVVVADHGYGDSPPTDIGKALMLGSHAMLAAADRSLRLAELVMCSTERGRTRVIRDHAGVEGRARVVHLGIDVSRYRPRAVDRASLGLEADRRYGLFVGSLSRRRGIDLAMEASLRVREREPSFSLIIAGQDTPTAPGGQPWLAWGKATYGGQLSEAIRYLGTVSEATLADLYAAVDVVLIPNRESSFSITVIEAIASGAPTVTSDAGIVPELRLPPGRVIVVADQSAEAYAAAVMRLLQAPQLVQTEELEALRAHFSIDQWVTRVIGIYEEAQQGWLARHS